MEIPLRRGGLTALADPQGGELVSLEDSQGTQYLWGGDPAYWSGRSPNLFPIVGALKGRQILCDGRQYAMSRHGFAKASLFTPVEQGEDHVVFELRESQDTLRQYPYPFRLRIRHQLLEDGFYTQYQVANPGQGTLPFCVGGHPAFRCPLYPGESFQEYRLVFAQPETAQAMIPAPGGFLSRDRRVDALRSGVLPLSHALFDQVDTLVFEGLRSQHVSLLGPTGLGVRLAFGDFPLLALWTMPGANAPYLCLEPWHGCGAMEGEDGQFVHKPYCIQLPPGQERRLRYTVTLLSHISTMGGPL